MISSARREFASVTGHSERKKNHMLEAGESLQTCSRPRPFETISFIMSGRLPVETGNRPDADLSESQTVRTSGVPVRTGRFVKKRSFGE